MNLAYKKIFAAVAVVLMVSQDAMAAGITIGAGAEVTSVGSPMITTNGDWDNNGTFTAGTGMVTLNGATSTILEAGSSAFNDLTINKTAAADGDDNVTVQTDNLTVNGATTITDGELVQGVTNFALTSVSVAAAGKYSNSSTGDLTLAGAVANAGTIAFDAGGGGGGGADDILIRSSVSGTQRNWQGAGTFSMTDVDVKDQTAIGGTPPNINVTSGTNNGNNINWVLGAITLSGTVYNGKAEAGTLNFKNLTIIQYSAGITTTYTTTTDGAGLFSIAMVDAMDGDPILIFLNNEAEEGNLVYISDGLSVADLKVYQNEVSLRNDSGSGITNTNLSNIDNGDDDIKYNVAAGAATFESAFELFVFTGSTYAPGGAATFHDLDLNGTFVMAANAIECSGDWDATGGAYSSTGTVTFTSTAAQNITSNGDSASAAFNHVVFNGVGGNWTLQDNLDVNGNLTLSNGTLTAGANTINAAGNWSNAATFDAGTGTVIFDGSGTQILTSVGTGIAANDTGIDFNNLTISGATLQVASGSELEVDGTLSIAATKSLDVNAQTLDLNGTLSNDGTVILEGSETIGVGTWDTDSGSVKYVGDSVTLPSAIPTYFNLEFDETVNGQTFTLPDTAVTVNGRLTVTDGIVAFDDDKSLTLNDNGLTGTALSLAAAGTLSNLGTGDLTLKGAVLNAGTITFNSSDDAGNGISILSSGSPTQRNWQGAGTFSMTDVTVMDQTAVGGTPASITALSSTDSGNNVNWLFAGGALAATSVTPADLQAGNTSNNTVVFTTTSAIPSNGKIRITFPAGFDVSGVTTATSASDLDGILTVSVSGQVVTVTRSGGTNFPAGGTVDDLILAGVVNPVAIGLTGTFTLETLDASNVVIDTGTPAGVTITPSLSTASTTQLTDSTGAAATAFTVGSTTTGSIYIRVADADENTNALVAETITVTVQSAATGDQETVTLTETGVNTGVFNNLASGLAFDVDNDPVASNGILETRPGDTITARYVDNDDGADITTATASMTSPENLIIVTLNVEPKLARIGDKVYFSGTVENRSSETITGFKLVSHLPSGVVYEAGSAELDSGSFVQVELNADSVIATDVSALAPGAIRGLGYRGIVGSSMAPGSYTADLYAQVNPIISNTAQVTILIKPDPIFHIGTLIGKVFWDINKNGVQDEGETGIPNATVATEQGYVITTDQYGRYNVPDFLSGRHMIKIDRNSLPHGSTLTTPESVLVNQTDAMLTKVNFGVLIPEEAAEQFEKERASEATLMVRKDPATPSKRFELQFHRIATPEADAAARGAFAGTELVQTAGASYETKAGQPPVLPFRIDMNYSRFVKSWSFAINRYTDENQNDILQHGVDRKRRTEVVAHEPRMPTATAFQYAWDLPLYENDARINYEVVVTLKDEKGNEDVATYNLIPTEQGEAIQWRLEPVERVENIPVAGSTVVVEGTTHANKIVSLFGREDLSGANGEFRTDVILPAGNHTIPVLVYREPGAEPMTVIRSINLQDTYFFWVGFSEYEYGHMNIKGNIQSVTSDDKARFASKWYDEGRVAYYLKGKIKGKYLITASVDTQREKRELFRNLEPEDYYAVYGDGSQVTADANDTQDEYYLLIEADKSYFKYGNFETGFTGTEFSDFNRTLHGAKVHYETMSQAPDGKPVTFITMFTAHARQAAARNEFSATGGSVYYLKHQDVIQGSEKIRLLVRDKVSGITLSERALTSGQDYSVDYDQGRVRLFRPASIFTNESGSILSTQLLPGNPQFIAVDYEYEPADRIERQTQGARATHMLWGNRLRVGGTIVNEDKDLERYGLTGTDAQLYLPAQTVINTEYAQSTMQSSSEYFSSNGGVTFEDAVAFTPTSPDGGEAYMISGSTRPFGIANVAAYYRHLDAGFASNGTRNEAGLDKYGVEYRQAIGTGASLLLRHEEQSTLEDKDLNTLLTAPGSTTGVNEAFDQTVTLAQLNWIRGRWNLTGEYRDATLTGVDEKLAGAEARYQLNEKTEVLVAGQKSIGGDPNDQIRGGIERKITEDLSVHATQAFGSRGAGSSLGLESMIGGQPHSFNKGIGSLKENNTSTPSPTTVGFTKNFGLGTDLRIDEGVGGTKTRAVRLIRTSGDGRVMELVRETDENTTASTYTETVPLGPDSSKYSSSSVRDDKLTGTRIQSATSGYRAKIWGGRASVYKEEETSTDGVNTRTGEREGFGLLVGEYGKADFSFERNQEKTGESDRMYRVGRAAYEYYDYGKLEFKDLWELRVDNQETQATAQLFSAGNIKYAVNPDWTLVGRYEWAATQNMVTDEVGSQFSEIQTGFAYRPVANDRWNLFAEYKYLADQAPVGQIDLDAQTGTRRRILRGEVAFDITPKITLVEKLAMRDAQALSTTAAKEDSLSYLFAQRINVHLTDRWDVIGEYRILTSSLAQDSTQGLLLETSYRLTDALRLGVGYAATSFESEAAQDLDVETRAVYMRIFYDAIEEVRGVLERRSQKAQNVAGELETELERARKIPGDERDVQEISSRLRHANELMEKQRYDEAIEVLTQGLELYEDARDYSDRAEKEKGQFDFYMRQAKRFEQNGFYVQSFRSLMKAYQINAFDEELLDLMSDVRSQIKTQLELKRRIRAEQREKFEELKKIRDADNLLFESIRMHYHTGKDYYGAKLYEEAVQEWGRGLELAKKIEGSGAAWMSARHARISDSERPDADARETVAAA